MNPKECFQHVVVRGVVALAVAGVPAALLLTGLGATLGGRTIAGRDLGAFVEVSGVRMVLVPDQWSGSPANLRDLATPLA